MYMYVIMNKKTEMYLKWFKDINLKHYVKDINEASKYTFKEAKKIKNKYNYPENWEIKRKKIEWKENKK